VTRKAARGGEVSDLAELERRLGHQFRDPDLARQALTHRSFGAPHNERLEFLGDSLLNCAVATILYERFPQLPEGDLSRLRAALVNQRSLSEAAVKLGLGDRLRLGEGELKSGGFRRESILADALEALCAALYLDGGLDAARLGMLRWLESGLPNEQLLGELKDPKTQLQELLQARGLPLPRYSIESVEGELHAQLFRVRCEVEPLNARAEGEGSSRRRAEQAAAARVLEQFRLEHE